MHQRTMIEPSLEMMAGALFELIALARVHEYTSAPGPSHNVVSVVACGISTVCL